MCTLAKWFCTLTLEPICWSQYWHEYTKELGKCTLSMWSTRLVLREHDCWQMVHSNRLVRVLKTVYCLNIRPRSPIREVSIKVYCIWHYWWWWDEYWLDKIPNQKGKQMPHTVNFHFLSLKTICLKIHVSQTIVLIN